MLYGFTQEVGLPPCKPPPKYKQPVAYIWTTDFFLSRCRLYLGVAYRNSCLYLGGGVGRVGWAQLPAQWFCPLSLRATPSPRPYSSSLTGHRCRCNPPHGIQVYFLPLPHFPRAWLAPLPAFSEEKQNTLHSRHHIRTAQHHPLSAFLDLFLGRCYFPLCLSRYHATTSHERACTDSSTSTIHDSGEGPPNHTRAGAPASSPRPTSRGPSDPRRALAEEHEARLRLLEPTDPPASHPHTAGAGAKTLMGKP